MFEGFVHPALAWGALLASVPLLIHLFNRQRHSPMPWAAMRFVMAAYRRTRRRTQLESLLLLLLRMAAIVLLALAVARPFTGRESALAPLTESRRDLVLVVDASGSTGYRENVRSVFEEELDRARGLLSDFDGTRGDRVRLYVAGARAKLLSARSPEDALAMLGTLAAPLDEVLDLDVVLPEVVQAVEEDAADRGNDLEVRLLSDLQRTSFAPRSPVPATPSLRTDEDEAGAEVSPPVLRALDRLHELGVSVVVEDLGARPPVPPNLGVLRVEPSGDVLGPGLATEVAVRVRNFGGEGRSGVRVALLVDGERTPSQSVDVPARSSAEAVFPVVFSEGGEHALEARLEGDRLALDDARARALLVPPPTRVLLVNGAPGDDVESDEVGYLRVVLEPTDDGGPLGAPYQPFRVETKTDIALAGGGVDLDEHDVVVLANTGPLSPRTVEALERRVAAGGALVFTLGDRYADPAAIQAFNARVWRADGSGLAPARLTTAHLSSRRESYFRIAWFEDTHPVLEFFADERWRPFLTEVPVNGFVGSEPVEGAHVLAGLDDVDRSPLFVERGYDRGRVFLWTTTIDADWTKLPESPASFVPFVHELLRYAGRGVPPTRNVPVGTVVQPEVEGFPRSPALISPSGTSRPVDGEPVEVADGLWRLPVLGPLEEVGLWRVETEGAGTTPYAVQLDPREGDLQRISAAELEGSHPAWRVVVPGEEEERGGAQDSDPDRGELWRWLAALTLLALVLETLWAAWIGRGRRQR